MNAVNTPFLIALTKVGLNITLLNDCHVAAKVANAFCDPLVFHEDGTAIKVNSPARPGELVSIRAIGMGTLTSGFPFEMQVLFTDGSVPLPGQELVPKPVDLVRFTPDAVGMYDVFVRLPEQIHPDARQCWTNGFGNTRVSVMRQGGRADFAGSVDICVQPFDLAP